MNPNNLLEFIRLIETISIEYMITGSVASILYGKPRLTQDMDVVVIFPIIKIDQFVELFDGGDYYCPPKEAIADAIKLGEEGHLNVIDNRTGFKIDIYPTRFEPLTQWGLKNKKRVELIAGESVYVAPPEYVILKKLLYYKEGGSEKHLDDIRGMLEVSGDQIDIAIIEEWFLKLGLKTLWPVR